ncbi:MAG: methyltransferase, partial [Anaerolineae bacterium]|nr:methyltransferase [Anaerolineae bacterium]
MDSIRYLEAKRSVDDRALNQRVWSTVWQELQAEAPRILELGCGIGTMIERVLQARPLPSADYTAVDLNPSFLDEARRRLRTWGQKHGFQVRQVDQVLILAGDGISLSVRFQQADITDNLRGAVSAGWDLLMANAVLDLVDLRT